MDMEVMGSFLLVGGTALSLRYGHRTSVDLDLFSTQNFDHELISRELQNTFGNQYEFEGGPSKIGIFCFIDNVKVDIINYQHLQIEPTIIEDGIRMYSSADIAAMKIQALLGRGKKKDFWDVAELLQHFTLQQIIDWHKQKFSNQMLLISIPQALTYFVDADEGEDPVGLKGQTWASVKQYIHHKVS